MLTDGLKLLEGSVVENLVIPGGTSFPSNPNYGEIFYRSDLDNIFMYENSTSTWVVILKNNVTNTFTPNVYGSTTAGTTTYVVQSGFFTRVANLVHFSINIEWSASDGAGNLLIGGLPFTNALNKVSCSVNAHNLTFSGQLGAQVNAATGVVSLVTSFSASPLSPVSMQSSGGLYITGMIVI